MCWDLHFKGGQDGKFFLLGEGYVPGETWRGMLPLDALICDSQCFHVVKNFHV